MIGVTWLIVMINWTCNSHFLASDWAVQNNELMTLINCHKKGHLTSLIWLPSRLKSRGPRRVFWNSSCDDHRWIRTLFDIGWRWKFRHWLPLMVRQHLSSRVQDRSGRKCAFLVGRLAVLECPMMIEWFRHRIRDVDEDRRISCLKNQILRKS